ncbi:MAG: protein arginine kinase [Candidatus Omnitrophica bacterium]|nr:protein arginine kinase [Candidatus Omnitrophota bacterium]MDD4013264.1 protein arginine kinase [Candidatus Omnitrophota bacterium]
MSIDALVSKKSEWLKGEGSKANVVMSSRVRLARNIEGQLFYDRASDEQRDGTRRTVSLAVKRLERFSNAFFLDMRDTSDVDRKFLLERHLISKEHMQDVQTKGLVVDENEVVSLMLNEEDHIRLQVLRSGFSVMEAWSLADAIDTELSHHLPFDYSRKFGYLTSCPTNTGTGLRASVMLHLPAMVMASQVESLYEAISKLGLTMRGFYGEGTEALGDFFQISNQVALGSSEMDILDNLERIVQKIIASEESTREEFLKKKKEEFEDRVFRSFGTLKSARIITSGEAIKLLSAVRLGVELGFIKGISTAEVNEVLIFSQSAHLQKLSGQELGRYERDVKRADLIRKKLGGE